MATATYTAKDIQVLKGLEPVRLRPAMYIGSTDAKGLHHLVWEIVDNAVDEYLNGYADAITVTLHKDGQSVTVADNGRGIPVDLHPKEKRPALELILTTLHAGGKFTSANYLRSGGLHGVGASVVNALSVEMVATVRRDGYEWTQRYRRGKPTTAVKKVGKARGHGTTVFFRPDDEIFRRVHFNSETIRTHLEDMSYIHRGLKITYIDEEKGEKHDLTHTGGIQEYLTRLVTEGQRRRVTEAAFYVERNGDEPAEAVLQWTEATDEHVRSYVNGIRTHMGGTHESGLKSAIVKAVRNYMEVHEIKGLKGLQIAPEDIREGVVGVLSVFHRNPMFQGQTKERLNNPELAGQIDGWLRPALESWLNSNPTAADRIIGRIVLAAQARAASRAAASEVRRKSPTARRLNLPGKLADCRSTKPEECELFIVEGQSAGGSAKAGRDSRFQAVLPLKGKVLNSEGATLSKVLSNAELKDVVDALGTGIGEKFDIARLRYHKVILLMDADADGHHITTLLLTFFFRHLPELIRRGHVYLAQPPLYRIDVAKETYWARDDAHKEEILAGLRAGAKVNLQRFKGLGEMMAATLRDTTLDPARRTLLQVSIESDLQTHETFVVCMGKDPSLRYKFIMDSAALADELDI